MPLEEPDVIDIIAKVKDGRLLLIITDSGATPDPDERYALLLSKLRTYVAYILSDLFKVEYPDIEKDRVIIRVSCANEPTSEMMEIDKLVPHGDRDLMIPVEFEKPN